MIKIENTLKTSVTYNGTGTQTRFDFPFDYLRKSFVYVSVNNALMNNTTDYTIDGRTVVFNTAPASGSVIRIYRETTTDRLVVWADASVLKAADMTIQQVQQLHILEEANDWTKSNSIVLNDEGTAWQGRNYRLSNISDPVDEQDAVTKRYMETVQGGFVTENTKIKDEATRQAGLAKDEKLKAQQYAEYASDSKDLAKRWAEATDSPDYTTSKSAKTWAEEAKDARDEAKDTAVNLGNPVVNITEDKGTVTVTKSNGTQSTFMAFPQDANGTLPIAKGGTGATTASDACANIGALPTSGGTMTGTIAFNNGNMSNSQVFDNSGEISDFKGFYMLTIDKDNVAGARLILRHASSPKESGCFTLQANKDDNRKSLVGTPSGSLTWVGKEVERVNVTDKSSYIRFESGLQICFSTLDIPANSKGINWTFPAPFKSNGDMLLTATYISPNPTCIATFTGRNTTKVTVNCLKVDGAYDFARSVACIAIGWWK